MYEQWLCENALKSLQAEIDQALNSSHELRQVVDQLLRRPLRSSSLVEAFNARIRVLQTARRNVSDELLGLAALQWDINTREDRPRKGSSPYNLVGVLVATTDDNGGMFCSMKWTPASSAKNIELPPDRDSIGDTLRLA